MKRWSQGELEERRRQVASLCASHDASPLLARKKHGTWRCCQDYHGLHAIAQRSAEPLPHVDQLVDETRGALFFRRESSKGWTLIWPTFGSGYKTDQQKT